MMSFRKLDRRFNGSEHFSHRVEFYSNGWGDSYSTSIAQWIAVRNWLWSQFGPSSEQKHANTHYFEQQPRWSWDTDKMAIYLAEEAYTMFMLRYDHFRNVGKDQD